MKINFSILLFILFIGCAEKKDSDIGHYSLVKETWSVSAKNEKLLQKDFYDLNNDVVLSILFNSDINDTISITSSQFSGNRIISSTIKNKKLFTTDVYHYANDELMQKIRFRIQDTFDITSYEYYSNGNLKKEVLESIFDTIHPYTHTYINDSAGNRLFIYSEFYEDDSKTRIFEFEQTNFLNSYDPGSGKLINQIVIRSGSGYNIPDTVSAVEYKYDITGKIYKLVNNRINDRFTPDSVIYHYNENGTSRQTIQYFSNTLTSSTKIKTDTTNFSYNNIDSLIEINNTTGKGLLFKYIKGEY